MDERAQRRVLGLAIGMFAGYALSAACFALAFATRQRWPLVLALLTAATGIALSTLIRPVVLGYARWWEDAPVWRRTLNVFLLIARVAGVGIVGWAAFTFVVR
jgi:hypothetical protein